MVDAFSCGPFTGNPAGVVLLDRPVDDAWLQSVAAELKHSETAFVSSRPGGYDLRWFTPTVEVTLCGHATLASAHVLAADGAEGPFDFHTRSGVLSAWVEADGELALDFPAVPPHPVDRPAALAEALGAEPRAVLGNGMDLLVELHDAVAVADLTPDIDALRSIECRGVAVTAVGTGEADFVSRFFGPRVGVPEDPVTGSAHCMLAPYWAEQLGRTTLTGVQLSARGGRIGVEVRDSRVVLRGRAVTVLSGTLGV